MEAEAGQTGDDRLFGANGISRLTKAGTGLTFSADGQAGSAAFTPRRICGSVLHRTGKPGRARHNIMRCFRGLQLLFGLDPVLVRGTDWAASLVPKGVCSGRDIVVSWARLNFKALPGGEVLFGIPASGRRRCGSRFSIMIRVFHKCFPDKSDTGKFTNVSK